MRRRLTFTPPRRTYTQNGHGGGRRETVADPENGAGDHGADLAVDGHREVGEELDRHARGGQVGNWHLHCARQPGIHGELEEHAENALKDDEDATGGGERARLRVAHGGGAEEVVQVDAVARLVRVGGPAHAELEGEAQTHGARDVDLRSVDGLHLLLVLLHYR